MNYNPNEYETVKERKMRFFTNFPDARIETDICNDNVMEYALICARVYKDRDDQEKRLPRGTGYAMETRDKELSVSRNGKEYASVNYTSWVENCEESAIGRALDNAGYSGNRKCSREEMEKAQRMEKKLPERDINNDVDENPFTDTDGKDLFTDKVKDTFNGDDVPYSDRINSASKTPELMAIMNQVRNDKSIEDSQRSILVKQINARLKELQ